MRYAIYRGIPWTFGKSFFRPRPRPRLYANWDSTSEVGTFQTHWVVCSRRWYSSYASQFPHRPLSIADKRQAREGNFNCNQALHLHQTPRGFVVPSLRKGLSKFKMQVYFLRSNRDQGRADKMKSLVAVEVNKRARVRKNWDLSVEQLQPQMPGTWEYQVQTDCTPWWKNSVSIMEQWPSNSSTQYCRYIILRKPRILMQHWHALKVLAPPKKRDTTRFQNDPPIALELN